MTKIENKTQYDWAVNRVEELLPLVDDNTPKMTKTSSSLSCCRTSWLTTPRNISLLVLHRSPM